MSHPPRGCVTNVGLKTFLSCRKSAAYSLSALKAKLFSTDESIHTLNTVNFSQMVELNIAETDWTLLPSCFHQILENVAVDD